MWLRLLALSLLAWASPAWALQPISVDQQGARPDGVVRTDCSITAGSAVLNCPSGRFATADVGKAIGVYGAKTPDTGYVQVLATTIASRQSATQVTLAAAATVTANPSPRVVYGTDNTVTIQRIVDTTVAAPNGRGGNVGGEVIFGPGTYLLKTLFMPCSRVGVNNVASGFPPSCTRAYNNIWLRGSGQFTTVLENIDPSATTALISIADYTTPPDYYGDGNRPLVGLSITDMTVHQVLNAPSGATKVISAITEIEDSRVERVFVTGTSYECLYLSGFRLIVRDNYASGCSHLGPGRGIAVSAFNIPVCSDCLFLHNRFDMQYGGAPYASESGFRRSVVMGNHFVCDPTNLSGGFGFEMNSSNLGLYDIAFIGNTIHHCSTGLDLGNVLGTANRFLIKGNVFVNSGLFATSGVESQGVSSNNQFGELDTVIHGVSVIDGNSFILDGVMDSTQIGINIGSSDLYAGQESWQVTNNTLSSRRTQCSTTPFATCQSDADCSGSCIIPAAFIFINKASGGLRWTPSTACTAAGSTPSTQRNASYVYPVVYNGYYYRCTTAGTTGTTEPTWPTGIAATVSDGTAVWTNAGRKPTIWLANNVMQGPEHLQLDYQASVTPQVSLRADADRDSIHFVQTMANYPWQIQIGAVLNQTPGNESIPAGVPYGDANQYRSALPTVGFYAVNTRLTPPAPSAGARGWVATRAGRAGATWTAAQAYAFGDWVVPTADNAHAYTQRTPGGCTSHASTQPTWPTSAGGTVSDNTCSWQESGAAVLWLQF